MRSLVIVLFLLSSCGFNTLSNGQVSRSLAVGMTEHQVVALKSPDRVQSQVCGGTTGSQWNCKIYVYESYHSGSYRDASLNIVFEYARGVWVVNSWM